MGLLPGIILMCLPVVCVVLFSFWKYKSQLHWLRWSAIAGMLIVFFVGSTVVSLRAGGGYDLHNFDSLLLLLLISGCFFGLRAVSADKPIPQEKAVLSNYAVLFGLLAVSIIFAYHPVQPIPASKSDQSAAAIQQIALLIQQNAQTGHPVLFIDDRQLLVYGMISETQIYVPYDKIELEEMAMARNPAYSQQFSTDIKNQKYSLIVSEVLPAWLKPFHKNQFARDWYENNVWVDVVSTPVLAYYTPIYINEDLGFAVYAPK